MEGKAISSGGKPWPPRRERAFAGMLEELGSPPLGGDPLDAPEPVFDRGMELVKGQRQPDGNEAGPLRRFGRSGRQ
ncbi:MAG TPA: hypothetical protein VJU14_02540 [Solirubrobacterales bacterium]|nr:hypothetical protein [Solirubrobacterales bacterium]